MSLKPRCGSSQRLCPRPSLSDAISSANYNSKGSPALASPSEQLMLSYKME